MPITWIFSGLGMTWFEFANLAATLLSLLVLVAVFVRRPQVFVRPSMQVIAFYHFLIQWPVTYLADFIESWVRDDWHVILQVHGFVIIGIPLAMFGSRRTSQQIWLQLRGDGDSPRMGAWPVNVLLVATFACVAVYLSAVDIRDTGLYVFLTDPARAIAARGESLKGLEAMHSKYALHVLSSTVAPLYTGFAVLSFLRRSGNWRDIYPLLLMPLVWGLALLSGAKGIAVFLLMTAMATYFWDCGLRPKIAVAALAIPIALIPAALYIVIIANASYDTGAAEVGDRLAESVLRRAFLVPATTGVWHIDYAQAEGTVGISGQLRLASALGEQMIRLPYVVGQYYGPAYYGGDVASDFSANTGFLFTSYACFGLFGLPLALLLLLFCDLPLLLLKMLPRGCLVPAMAATSVAALKFVQSDYTTVWVTHGFGLIGLLAWALWAVHQLKGTVPARQATSPI